MSSEYAIVVLVSDGTQLQGSSRVFNSDSEMFDKMSSEFWTLKTTVIYPYDGRLRFIWVRPYQGGPEKSLSYLYTCIKEDYF